MPTLSLADNYRKGIQALRRSQPFRALLFTFLLQGLATGLMLAGAQYVARWVLDTGVTILFLSLIAPAISVRPALGDRVAPHRQGAHRSCSPRACSGSPRCL